MIPLLVNKRATFALSCFILQTKFKTNIFAFKNVLCYVEKEMLISQKSSA